LDVSSIGTRIYTSHHETLDTSRSLRKSRCAAKCHAAVVTGLLPIISPPASEAAHRIDPFDACPEPPRLRLDAVE
jgi:hypothetical protein